jgi:uncharacterized protein (DUF1778 family)
MCGKLPYIKKARWLMATTTAMRDERLDARVTREEKEMIETAASLSGTSASDFIRMATRQAALSAIREHEVLTLNEEAKRVFVEALLNPPKPNENAIAAARRLKEEIA